MNAFRGQWLLLRRDRAAWLAYLLFCVVCFLAAAQGVSNARREQAFFGELAADESARIAALLEDMPRWHRPDQPWNDPTNPGATGKARAATVAFLPPAPMAALRPAEVRASAVSVSTQTGALDRALGNIENPRLQGIGAFDLAFVIVVLLPLAILGLTFDVVVRDRETGTMRLLLAQGAAPTALYACRAVVRALPLVLIALFFAFAASLASGGATRAADGAMIIAAVLAYAAFWLSVSLAVQAPFQTSASAGMAALAAWLVFVVAIPAVLAAFVDARVPIPSRIERTMLAREASRQAALEGSKLLARYYEDHPELAGEHADASDYYARQVVVSQRVRAARAPVEAHYRDALTDQRDLVRQLSAISPVVIIDQLLDDLAGVSPARAHAFRDQVDAFQLEFAAYFDDRALRGEKLTRESVTARPHFAFREIDPAGRPWTLGALLAWCLFAGLFSWRTLGAQCAGHRAVSAAGAPA